MNWQLINTDELTCTLLPDIDLYIAPPLPRLASLLMNWQFVIDTMLLVLPHEYMYIAPPPPEEALLLLIVTLYISS